MRALEGTVRYLVARGQVVHVLGAGPRFRTDLRQIALRHGSLAGLDEAADEEAVRRQYKVDSWAERFVEELGGTYIRQEPFFCPEGRPCRAVTASGRGLLVFDREHLTFAGALELGEWLGRRHAGLFSRPAASPTPD